MSDQEDIRSILSELERIGVVMRKTDLTLDEALDHASEARKCFDRFHRRTKKSSFCVSQIRKGPGGEAAVSEFDWRSVDTGTD